MQTLALQITGVLMLAVVACFAWVISRSGKNPVPYDTVAKPAYRMRSWLLSAAVLAGIALTLSTLTPWPHSANAASVTRSIDIKARQWMWEVSDTQGKVGDVVEFRVTSEDVNHGFALYDPHDRIVAQVQAMPGFTNRVRHRFTEPGAYKILCLEYCGIAHHGMEARIEVQADASPR